MRRWLRLPYGQLGDGCRPRRPVRFDAGQAVLDGSVPLERPARPPLGYPRTLTDDLF